MSTSVTLPRLLLLASTFPAHAKDGTPAFVRDLAFGLTSDFEVEILVPAVPGAPRLETYPGLTIRRYRYFWVRWEDLADGAILENLRNKKSRMLQVLPFLLASYWHMWWASRRFRPDVVHAFWIIPQGLLAALAMPRRATVITTLGGDLYALQQRFLRWLKGWAVRRADLVTVMNSDMAEQVRALGVRPRQVLIEPMGTDVKLFHDTAAARRASAADGKIRLLAVGRLVPKKGFHTLLQTLRQLPAAEWELTLVGAGPERKKLRKLGKGLPITWAGQLSRPELAQVIAASDIAIFPSQRASSGDQDGLPVAMLEAMAGGCAIIASDLPGLNEAIRAEENGLLVPPADQQALQEALNRLIADADLRLHLGKQAAERAKHYDIGAVSARYARLLRSVLAEAATGE